jgi:hypothetical protein
MSNHIPENKMLRLQALEGPRILDAARQPDCHARLSNPRDAFDVPVSTAALIDRDLADVISEQAAALVKQKRMFDYGSALTRMGV